VERWFNDLGETHRAVSEILVAKLEFLTGLQPSFSSLPSVSHKLRDLRRARAPAAIVAQEPPEPCSHLLVNASEPLEQKIELGTNALQLFAVGR